MIQHLNSQELPSFDQAAGDLVIFGRRLRISGRVIMKAHECSRSALQGPGKHLPRVNQAPVQQPLSDDALFQKAVLVVQQDNNELLLLLISQALLKVLVMSLLLRNPSPTRRGRVP